MTVHAKYFIALLALVASVPAKAGELDLSPFRAGDMEQGSLSRASRTPPPRQVAAGSQMRTAHASSAVSDFNLKKISMADFGDVEPEK